MGTNSTVQEKGMVAMREPRLVKYTQLVAKVGESTSGTKTDDRSPSIALDMTFPELFSMAQAVEHLGEGLELHAQRQRENERSGPG